MKNVMTRAWEIAKEAVVKFGGKVREYFALSLRQAWSEVKKGVDKMEKYRAEYERRQAIGLGDQTFDCLLYTSPSPRDRQKSRMPSSA